MKLEEIAQQIEVKQTEWGNQYLATLDQVTSNPDIAASINKLIDRASKHPLSISGKPVEAVRNCLKLTASAEFRLGLLIGLMLDRPERTLIDDKVKQPCKRCDTTGEECFGCGKSKFDCTCGLGKFSPVKCVACDGEGYVA